MALPLMNASRYLTGAIIMPSHPKRPSKSGISPAGESLPLILRKRPIKCPKTKQQRNLRAKCVHFSYTCAFLICSKMQQAGSLISEPACNEQYTLIIATLIATKKRQPRYCLVSIPLFAAFTVKNEPLPKKQQCKSRAKPFA
jgi:hypothetical protein